MKTELPLITVTMASYNHAAYIEQALNSVLEEDYPNKDILIIDDGSTDGSVEIIERWIEKHKHEIKVDFSTRPNKGLIYTLNELLTRHKSDYIAFLASDDAFCNNGISKRMGLMLKTNKLMVVGDSKVIDDDGNITQDSWMKDVMKVDVNEYKTEKGIMKQVLVKPAISGSVVLINKKIYDKIGKYPSNFFLDDWFLYQRCAANKFIVYLDEVVGLYRRHSNNTSNLDILKNKRLVKSIIKTYWINWRLFPGLDLKIIALKQWVKWNYIYLRTYIIK